MQQSGVAVPPSRQSTQSAGQVMVFSPNPGWHWPFPQIVVGNDVEAEVVVEGPPEQDTKESRRTMINNTKST